MQLLAKWLIKRQIGQLDQVIASLLRQHQDAVERRAEVPGLGVDLAQQIIAEVGAKAATFASAKNLSSWVGACPGEEESAGVNYGPRSPKGNRTNAPHSQSGCQCSQAASLFAHRRAGFLIANDIMQNYPNQLTEAMRNRTEGFVVP